MSPHVDFNRPHAIVPTGDEQIGEYLVIPLEHCPVSNYIGDAKGRAKAETYFLNEMRTLGWVLDAFRTHSVKNPDLSYTHTGSWVFRKVAA